MDRNKSTSRAHRCDHQLGVRCWARFIPHSAAIVAAFIFIENIDLGLFANRWTTYLLLAYNNAVIDVPKLRLMPFVTNTFDYLLHIWQAADMQS